MPSLAEFAAGGPGCRACGAARSRRRPAVREPAPADRRAQVDRPDRVAPARAGRAAQATGPRGSWSCPTADADGAHDEPLAARRRPAPRPRDGVGVASAAAYAAQAVVANRPPTTRRRSDARGRWPGSRSSWASCRHGDPRSSPGSPRPASTATSRRTPTTTRPARSSRFLEGRIQALEARLRVAVIVEAAGARARGSVSARASAWKSTGTRSTYRSWVGAEADGKAGRISVGVTGGGGPPRADRSGTRSRS